MSSEANGTALLNRRDATCTPTLLVCDSSIIRLGLVHLLSDTGFQILNAGQADNSQSQSYAYGSAALIIVSAGQSATGVAETVERVRHQAASSKIVVLADAADATLIIAAYRVGADGLLLTTTRHDALIKALELIMMGERLFPSTALLDVTQEIELQQQTRTASRPQALNDEAPSPLRNLSEREREVLNHLTKGAQDKVIARDLNLAEATVKVHIKSLLKKLGAQNRTQAAVLGVSFNS